MARSIGEGINEGIAALMNFRAIRKQEEQQNIANQLNKAKIMEAGYQIGPGGQLTQIPGFEDWTKRKQKADALLAESGVPLNQAYVSLLRNQLQQQIEPSKPSIPVMQEQGQNKIDYSGQATNEVEGTIFDDDETGISYQVINGVLERI